MNICYLLLAYAQFVGAQFFTPRLAPKILSIASNSDPSAKDIHNLCGFIGKSDADCVNIFFANDPLNYFFTSQATINCMSKIDVSQKQEKMLLSALNADTSQISQYALGAMPGVVKRDEAGNTLHFSPSDQLKAMNIAQKRAESTARAFFEKIAPVQLFLVEQLFLWSPLPEIGEVFSAASEKFELEDKLNMLYNTEDHIHNMGIWYGVFAYDHPWTEVEPTGVCPPHDPQCYDIKDGNWIPFGDNPDYTDPDVTKHHDEEGPDPDSFDTSDTELDMNPEKKEPPPTHDGVDTPPVEAPEDPEDIRAEDEGIVEPDAEAEKNLYMKQCVDNEEAKLIRQIGTVRKSNSEIPVTEEDKKQNAERELQAGFCDKLYWGDSYCKGWKQDRWTTPMDSETLNTIDQIGYIQNWLCRPSVYTHIMCDLTKQELDKRYDMNQIWEKTTSVLFGINAPPIKHPVPIEFEDEIHKIHTGN